MTKIEKQSAIISLRAQTHIHVGVGQSTGALDLPVSREHATHYPFVPGSGVKGAFRVWANERASMDNVSLLFGLEGAADEGGDGFAGHLLCSDAMLLLLSVRCLSDSFKWVTCPALLTRIKANCARAGQSCAFDIPDVKPQHYLGSETVDKHLGLEEREFARGDDVAPDVLKALSRIVGENELKNRLVIVSDKDFTYFARFALPIMTRNALDENKTVKKGMLWHEECLSPDTVMYLLFGERKPGAVSAAKTAIKKAPYIQMGGNETIGQGWFKMALMGEAKNAP